MLQWGICEGVKRNRARLTAGPSFDGTDFQYAVAHNSVGVGGNYVYMEPINWTIPNFLAQAPSTLYDYFQVNFGTANTRIWNFEVAISTPCNNPSDRTLVAWVNANNLTTNDDVYYKLTDYGPPNGYSFRHSPTPNVIVIPDRWAIYPNPTANTLNISNPDGDRYAITDMLGRRLMQGNISPGEVAIDVQSLVPGSYIFTAYGNNIRHFNSIFVKE